MKVEYGDTSGDDGDTASSLQSDNQEEELEEEMEESVQEEIRGQEQQQMEKVDSVSGFLKQRKLGLPRLVRTISHDPTKIKAGAMVLMMLFVSGNDSTPAGRRYLFCAEFSPFPRQTGGGGASVPRGHSKVSEESVVTGWSRPHPGPALAPCFPSVLLQLEEADTGRDLEQHFAMFSLALKSDRTNLIERVGRTFSIMFLVVSLGIPS